MQTEILEANELRQRATNEPFQRVSMAESDGLPQPANSSNIAMSWHAPPLRLRRPRASPVFC